MKIEFKALNMTQLWIKFEDMVILGSRHSGSAHVNVTINGTMVLVQGIYPHSSDWLYCNRSDKGFGLEKSSPAVRKRVQDKILSEASDWALKNEKEFAKAEMKELQEGVAAAKRTVADLEDGLAKARETLAASEKAVSDFMDKRFGEPPRSVQKKVGIR